MTKVTLGGQELELGDLTAGALEDFPDEANLITRPDAGHDLVSPYSRAIITLAAEAARRGGAQDMTREKFRELVRVPDMAGLIRAVTRAMGFTEAQGPPGEAPGPRASRPSGASSAA